MKQYFDNTLFKYECGFCKGCNSQHRFFFLKKDKLHN